MYMGIILGDSFKYFNLLNIVFIYIYFELLDQVTQLLELNLNLPQSNIEFYQEKPSSCLNFFFFSQWKFNKTL